MPIRVTVFGENLHEQKANDKVLIHYPNGMHNPSARLSAEVALNAPCCNERIPEARFAAGKEAAR